MAGKLLMTSLLAVLAVANAESMYTKSSPVLQVDYKNYDRLIAKSNYTSIVEFYAPWCGHCKNLKPAYEKAAKNLVGLAKVAAVDCDDDSNKGFCGSMGVQGFPTLKIVRPGAKTGKPVVEDYQGPRSAKGIVDAVVEKITNHVKRLNDKNVEEWLSQSNDTAKAILFTEKGTTSALLRALAVDFLSSISIAQIRNKETAAVEMFGVSSFPTLVLLPGGGKDGLVYKGEMRKGPLLEFLGQVATPNPDPAPKAEKASTKKTKPAKSSSASSKFSKASASHQTSEASEAAASATKETVEEDAPTESPDPKVEPDQKPVHVSEVIPPLPEFTTANDLAAGCLRDKTGTCVLLLLPPSSESETPSNSASTALLTLGELAHKHTKRGGHFPINSVPATNEESAKARRVLGLSTSELELIAVNGRRGWWRRYGKQDFGMVEVEGWLDALRLGEGEKQKLPDGVIYEAAPQQQEAEHDEL